MNREYWTNRISEASTRRNYQGLPGFERDAAKMFFTRELKGHIPTWIIGPRIKASKAETFQELQAAMDQVFSAWDAKMEQFK